MITQLIRKQRFVNEDGTLIQRAFKVLQELVQLDILSGSGSPEGVIEAKARKLYMKTDGVAGDILYIKKTDDVAGDKKDGWIKT